MKRPCIMTAFLLCLAVLHGVPAHGSLSPEPPTAGAAKRVTIAAAGDIACKPPYSTTTRTCQHRATARLIAKRNPTAVLTLGDQQYEVGALSAFNASYDPSWGLFKTKTNPVLGNHEYGTSQASGYFSYFGTRARRAPGYYAYNLGSWRLYALNSNCDRIDCAAQVDWLRADLATNPRRCSLAYMHHPKYSSGHHGGITMVAPLWPPLDKAGVDVILQGHDHSYERFGRMSAAGGPSPNGIRSFVSGLGGKSRYGFNTTKPGSQFRYDAMYGVLFMTLADTGYSWRFRTINGGVIRDEGSDACV